MYADISKSQQIIRYILKKTVLEEVNFYFIKFILNLINKLTGVKVLRGIDLKHKVKTIRKRSR